jgi:hypothetical protein
MGNVLGTSFATSGFSFDPNLSPNNQSFSYAVRAVSRFPGFFPPPVNVLQFGADPTGSADSTGAFIAATTGNSAVYVPSGTYLLTAGKLSFTSGARITGAGRGHTILKFTSGTSDLLAWSGTGQGGGITGAKIDATGVTGGNAISFSGQSRGFFDDLVLVNGFNGILVTDQNVCDLGSVWINGFTGSYGLEYLGGGSGAAQVLNIGKLQIGFAGTNTSSVGLLVDGDADTINADTVAVVNGSVGCQIQNSTNLVAGPQFVTVLNFQSQSAQTAGLSINGGSSGTAATGSHEFGALYVQGCKAGPGVTINAQARDIALMGGQVTSNFQQGILNNGRYVRVMGLRVSNNSLSGTASYPGIEMGSTSKSTTIIGGLSGQAVGISANNQSYGILIDSGSVKTIVAGIDLTGNQSGPISDGAGDTNSSYLYDSVLSMKGFSAGGTSAPTVQGYGPTAAGLVDMTPDTGSYNGTMTGVSNTTTVACTWARMGNIVVLTVNPNGVGGLGTSNATNLILGQLPAAITPSVSVYVEFAFVQDNGSNLSGNTVLVSTSGNLQFQKGTAGSGSTWTNTGQKGLPSPVTFVYKLS